MHPKVFQLLQQQVALAAAQSSATTYLPVTLTSHPSTVIAYRLIIIYHVHKRLPVVV